MIILSSAPPIDRTNRTYVLFVKVEKPLEYLRLELILVSVGINRGDPGIINPHFQKSIFFSRFFKYFLACPRDVTVVLEIY